MVGAAHWNPLGPGEFPRVVFRLWRSDATGVLTVSEGARSPQVLVLLRGSLVVPESDALGRGAVRLLETICSWRRSRYHFDGGVNAYPPGGRRYSLGGWVRRHYEGQIDRRGAEVLISELAGTRLSLKPRWMLPDSLTDETDRRIIAAMALPRRLDQIWPLARCPKFRLLAFVHFVRQTGGLSMTGVAAPAPMPIADPKIAEARRLLGVGDELDRQGVKRAYRRRVRALHPDLHPGIPPHERRALELRLADVNRAYQFLTR